jgi:hypothetical protein
MTQWVFIKARISASVGGPDDWARAADEAVKRKRMRRSTAAPWSL